MVRLLRVQDLGLGPLVDEECVVLLVDIKFDIRASGRGMQIGGAGSGTPIVLYEESLYLMNAINFGKQITP